jgi:hypothetical protein
MSTNNRSRQALAPKPKQVAKKTGGKQQSPPQQARRIVTSDDEEDDENSAPSNTKNKSSDNDKKKKKKSNSADDNMKKNKSNSADIRAHMASSDDVQSVRIDETNKSNFYDDKDDEDLLDNDDDDGAKVSRSADAELGDDGEEVEEDGEERRGDIVHLDVPVSSSRSSSGLPPRPSSSHSRSTSAGDSSGPGSSRAPSPLARSSSEVSTSSPTVCGISQEIPGINESATMIDPAMMRRIMKLPCAFPYANSIWSRNEAKLTNAGAFQFVLTDDGLRGVDLHDHFKLVFFFMFHLVMVNINEHNPRSLALTKLTWQPEWKCIHPVVSTAIQTSALFKGDLFKRRVEYFKRYLQDKIILRMPSFGDFIIRTSFFQRRSVKWLTEDHLCVLRVLE